MNSYGVIHGADLRRPHGISTESAVACVAVVALINGFFKQFLKQFLKQAVGQPGPTS
jgi:hypothetical protein